MRLADAVLAAAAARHYGASMSRLLCSSPARHLKACRHWLALGLSVSWLLVATGACGGDPAPFDGTLEVESGAYGGELTLQNAPLAVGYNGVSVALVGEADEPIAGAEVSISPWMPAHGHGSTDVVATEEGPGVYVSDEVRFTMSGVWLLRIHVRGSEGEGDLVATLEVP